jgi:hypothetical protein
LAVGGWRLAVGGWRWNMARQDKLYGLYHLLSPHHIEREFQLLHTFQAFSIFPCIPCIFYIVRKAVFTAYPFFTFYFLLFTFHN